MGFAEDGLGDGFSVGEAAHGDDVAAICDAGVVSAQEKELVILDEEEEDADFEFEAFGFFGEEGGIG